ncbi:MULTISPECIES: HPr(Ser) kinase/phosphatase [Companilactobacillus]|jgi:HPr kinase/phosphorylase|uniref:HPr kinase/phosphorylase n=4 Tax=Companilactobacillus TaxID=2767879 RepID=A0A5B7T1V0_9LACO|nr:MULTISPECIES: HPr(Ser) kinase/phosphatase [Companilactobacillus]AKP03469.1 serine kinase [Companilactobacillus farciminis]AKS51772.1 serine kinase [Companilactobacillus farciminis]KRK93560.1 HPr kinase phosphorylase [Companilactobacillus futsaii JCM 17355]MDG5112594.1 HPr(Ser) kinase/phosphatase [Companilactobacillus pabuli]QCX24265.1 HPr kinase/phosphorylase [Companilactobacillus futsaii]
MTNFVTVSQLVKDNELKVYSGEELLEGKKVITSDISRPGIELTGYFDYYPSERIQLFGQTESAYSRSMTSNNRYKVMLELCREDTPALLISRNIQPSKEILQAAKEHNVPVIGSTLPTTRLSSMITEYLDEKLAPRESIHGVLVDVYGIGILLTGHSGIGKSETALELVKRGHRLIADDRVDVYQRDEKTIVGEAPKILNHLLEIRGIGIIDVMNLFGAGAVRSKSEIQLIINLENWSADKNYDRIGTLEDKRTFFDVDVPQITVPVKVGRNISIIIEVAAMNYRAKKMGYDATKKFEDNLGLLIKENEAKTKNDGEGK